MRDQEILAGLGEIAADSGTLGLTVYGNVGTNMQPVLSYTDPGQVQGAVAWLTGGFTGSEGPQGLETAGIEIAQLWDDNGALGLTIYGDVDGTLQPVFTSGDMGQGSGALAWLTGNFTGTGNDYTEIAQLWDDNGTLEMIVYGNAGDGNLGTVYAAPMNQPSDALAFLTGNFIGSGYAQIAQARNNNGALQLLVYGDIGNGGLSTVFSNDISQVPFALAWVTGDFTGTGNTQILQQWITVFG